MLRKIAAVHLLMILRNAALERRVREAAHLHLLLVESFYFHLPGAVSFSVHLPEPEVFSVQGFLL